MSVWDKFQKELDRAGEAAKDVLDEGKLRIELYRVRQLADRAAEALGYAVHRAKRDGKELEAETMARLDSALGVHETDALRIEAELERLRQKESAEPAASAAGGPPPSSAGDAGASAS